jgi:hypothetical protein
MFPGCVKKGQEDSSLPNELNDNLVIPQVMVTQESQEYTDNNKTTTSPDTLKKDISHIVGASEEPTATSIVCNTSSV